MDDLSVLQNGHSWWFLTFQLRRQQQQELPANQRLRLSELFLLLLDLEPHGILPRRSSGLVVQPKIKINSRSVRSASSEHSGKKNKSFAASIRKMMFFFLLRLLY